MTIPMLTVGSIQILSLSDATVGFAPADMLPTLSSEQWAPFSEYLDADGLLQLNIGSYLIREGETWTLVDTGYGYRAGSLGGGLLAELERAEVHPDVIERVIVTHMHADHFAGSTFDLDGRPVPTFKNARYILQRLDWAHFQQSHIKEPRPFIGLNADPIAEAGLLDLIDGSQSISPGIATIFTPGHTPGHQSVLVGSDSEKVVIFGDMSQLPMQLAHPDWSPAYDLDPDLAAQTRADLFDRIEQEGLKIAAGHYPYPGFGGIVRVEGKRRWQPLS